MTAIYEPKGAAREYAALVSGACNSAPNLVQSQHLGEGGSRVCGDRITTHVETVLAPQPSRKDHLLQGAFRLAEGLFV